MKFGGGLKAAIALAAAVAEPRHSTGAGGAKTAPDAGDLLGAPTGPGPPMSPSRPETRHCPLPKSRKEPRQGPISAPVSCSSRGISVAPGLVYGFEKARVPGRRVSYARLDRALNAERGLGELPRDRCAIAYPAFVFRRRWGKPIICALPRRESRRRAPVKICRRFSPNANLNRRSGKFPR